MTEATPVRIETASCESKLSMGNAGDETFLRVESKGSDAESMGSARPPAPEIVSEKSARQIRPTDAAQTHPGNQSSVLQLCTSLAQLEEIIYDENDSFTGANLKFAFEALVRVCFAIQLPLGVDQGMSDSGLESLLSSKTWKDVKEFKDMGVVLLAQSLDVLQEFTPAHFAVILQAMGLLGLAVDNEIMRDLEQHLVKTLEECSCEDIVGVLVGMALLEYQPEENSLVSFERHVGHLSSQFDMAAQESLLWSFSRLGREECVQKARFSALSSWKTAGKDEPVKTKPLFLHGEELRKTFHPKLWRCPLLMHRRMALPPKNVYDQRSLLAMNARPPFSLRFTQPWVAEQMQRAEEVRELARTVRKPLLKGTREQVWRNVRMANAQKRFLAEDELFFINPDQSEKYRELHEALAAAQKAYEVAANDLRSADYKEQATLQILAAQLEASVEHRRAQLENALANKAAGNIDAALQRGTSRLSPVKVVELEDTILDFPPPKMIVAKVLWARFPKNMFSNSDSDTDAVPKLSHYFELCVNGQTTCMRTGGIPWAAESEFYDSFYLSEPGPDSFITLEWKYQESENDQTFLGGRAQLNWNVVELPPVNEVVVSLDIRSADVNADLTEKVGTCSVMLKRMSRLAGFDITRTVSNGLVPHHEDAISKCERLMKLEEKFAEKKFKEAEGKVEAAQNARWLHLDALQTKQEQIEADIICHQRVFGVPKKRKDDSAKKGSMDSDATQCANPGTPATPKRGSSSKSCSSQSELKGSEYAQSLPFFASTPFFTESLSIGVFDAAATSLLHPLTPFSQTEESKESVMLTTSRSALSRSSRPSSRLTTGTPRLGSPSHTYPEVGTATARSRARPALDVEKIGDFDAKSPLLSFKSTPNIIRTPWGLANAFPGSPTNDGLASPGCTKSPEEDFDLRFFAKTEKPLVEQYVRHKMKPHMLRTEGHLKTYLKSREIAVSKKNLPSNRDLQYDPGPEKLPRDRIEKTWRWDVQPVYQQTDSPNQKKLRYLYKRHLTHANAEDISPWPRGTPRSPSSCSPSSAINTPRRASCSGSTPRSPPITLNNPGSTPRGGGDTANRMPGSSDGALGGMVTPRTSKTTPKFASSFVPRRSIRTLTDRAVHDGSMAVERGDVRPSTAPAPAGISSPACPRPTTGGGGRFFLLGGYTKQLGAQGAAWPGREKHAW